MTEVCSLASRHVEDGKLRAFVEGTACWVGFACIVSPFLSSADIEFEFACTAVSRTSLRCRPAPHKLIFHFVPLAESPLDLVASAVYYLVLPG